MVAASFFMVFLSGAFGFGVFFKPMLEEFGWDRATLSSAQSIAFVVYALISPFLGRLLDRFGPRIMIFTTVATQALTGAIGGLATSLWQVFLSRFFFELRAFAYTQVLVNRWFDRKKGTALGIVATGMPVGTLVLTPVSQYLILAWDWRITMFFWGGVMFIILLALSFYIRDYPQDKGYAPDGERLDTTKPVGSISSPESNVLTAKQLVGTGSGLVAAMKTSAFW
ncbi:MAG: MFS transporter, partial [Rubrivivax sp.]|nr:MFS transporter [Rubrivivax sp.]